MPGTTAGHDYRTKVATVGVFVAAVLAACLILPAIGQIATLEGTWLAAAILGIPPAVVLAATGTAITARAAVSPWRWSLWSSPSLSAGCPRCFVVASALGGTATSLAMGVVLYGVPAVAVVILGLLALRLVPGRSAADQSFEHVDAG